MRRHPQPMRSFDPAGAFLLIALAFTAAILVPGPARAANPDLLFDNSTDQRPQSVPLAPTQFRLGEERRISAIQTYHWNEGRGAPPGSIALEGPGKRLFGPWPAQGRADESGLANAYWEVRPEVTLEPGQYTILDSAPGTWSRNPRQRNAGIARVWAWPAAETAVPRAGESVARGADTTADARIGPTGSTSSAAPGDERAAGRAEAPRTTDGVLREAVPVSDAGVAHGADTPADARVGQAGPPPSAATDRAQVPVRTGAERIGGGGPRETAAAPGETTADTLPPMPRDLMDEGRSRALVADFEPLPPLSRLLGDAKASAVAPHLDPGEFSRLQYLGAVTAVKQAMAEVAGPMTEPARREFDTRWDAIYEFPADAAVTYLNAAAPILGEILSLRASLAKTMQGYDNLLNQARMAQFVGNPEAAHELMRQAGRAAALLKALERGLSDAVGRFAALGELPDVAAIKQEAAQDYRRAKDLLRELAGPPALSGEYQPAPYESLQNPWGRSRTTPDTGVIRTEASDYDGVLYIEPLRSLGENRVLVYLCETDEEGDKSSWLQLFESTADGALVSYGGGSDLSQVVLQPTEDGFRKTEYAIGPREFSAADNDFSERMVEWLAKGQVPELDLAWDVRTRSFHATHVQYQSRPMDEEFDWSTWEARMRKHQREILAEFEGERQAFAALAARVALPEPVPAEHIYWVLERIEPYNKTPQSRNEVALFVLDEAMDATYSALMEKREYHTPRPMMSHARRTAISTSGLDNSDERRVYDDSAADRKVVDTLRIDHRIDWALDTPVVAQAGGSLAVDITAEREVSRPARAMLLPSPFPDVVASLSPRALEADGSYKGYAGPSVQADLLGDHARAGPGRVRQTSRISLPFDGFSSDTGGVTLAVSDASLGGSLYSLSGAGVELHFRRRIMTPDAAEELAGNMGADLERLAQGDRDAREERQRDVARATEQASRALEDAEAARGFHEATIHYEQRRAEQFSEELNALIDATRKSGKPPTEEQQERIAALRFNVISAQSNAIAERDRLTELETGRYVRSETPFDAFARVQFRQNIERNIKRLEALDTQHTLAETYISFLPEGERRQARQTLYAIAPDDLEKYQKLNTALKSKWHGHSEARIAALDEDLAWKDAQVEALENVKTGADVGLLATSMFGGPQAVALTYQFATGWAEKDLLTGIKQSVTLYSDAVDIAWSTYDGYRQDGWAGAAKAGGVSLLLNKGLPFLLGKMGKQGDLPDELPGGRATQADALGSAARQADVGTPTALRGTPRVDDVAQYRAELEQAEAQVTSFVSDYHAWRKGVKAGLPEDEVRQLHRRVIDATAAINESPTAKGYLKYKAPPAVGRFYGRSLDDLHAQARTRYYRRMREAGYGEHEIFPIRNAASAGSTGMDFDQALKEQPDYIPFRNADGTVSLRRNRWLTRNGQSVSRHEWQQDAQKAWNDAYREATGGYSAPHAWEKMTTRIDPEAYRLTAVLDIRKDLGNIEEIMDDLDPKWVRQMSDVTLFKAGEMLNEPNLSRLAGVREACRGTAKDLEGKFLPFIETRLTQLKRIEPSKLTAGDRHNMRRLESALETFTRVRDSFDAIGKADLPPNRWDDTIRRATGGKGIMQTIQDLGDLTQSLFM